jgi:hypothetical protein
MNPLPGSSVTTIHNAGHHLLLKPGTPNHSSPHLNVRRQGGQEATRNCRLVQGNQPLVCSTPPSPPPTTTEAHRTAAKGPCLTLLKHGGTPQSYPKEGPLQATAPPAGETPKAACLHNHSTAQGIDPPLATEEDTTCALDLTPQ